MKALDLCKTCDNADADEKGRYCKLTCKTCNVEYDSIFDECVNWKERNEAV